ncbi:DNA-processing protein DprA [Nitrospira defluvii]|uniref:Protein Smf n=1 Tax=Nitrospira defluvii TaxID=330214 RepID=A0ABM8QE71_9BACT|nr:DNA-processing protein DprA [Nitrospira defluvii]CAE6692478.1 protein Smf [Nitrospira defluvii]
MVNSHSLRPWLMLRAIPGVGDAVLLKLVQVFGDPEAVFSATQAALEDVGCRPQLGEAIRRGPDADAIKQLDHELTQLQQRRISVWTYLDSRYPAPLKRIADPPPLLYVQGTLEEADRRAVAIVGTRKVSTAGRAFAEELASDLAALGFTIVSGLARGVDAAAHRGALAGQGRTLAVMGCGLDRTYPADHRQLRESIEKQGAVLSELPLGAAPNSYHFPRRNRIISGLSLGVIVTEATVQSGSLITARLAGEQGREVFAVPGFVKAENSRGPNSLLKDGARLVESAQDIVEELLPQLDAPFREQLSARGTAKKRSGFVLAADEARVYAALSVLPQSVDDVIRRSELPAAQVAALLLSLELKNCVRQLPGNEYVRLSNEIP